MVAMEQEDLMLLFFFFWLMYSQLHLLIFLVIC